MLRAVLLLATMALILGCRSAPSKNAGGAGPTDGFVPSGDGVPIHYHVEGSGSPALVFLHGWACDGSIWADQVREFAPGHTVVTVDLAGHGRSGRNRATWSVPAFGQDAAAVIERLRFDRVVLVGHSMSGYVLLEAARLLPDRIVLLVPVDTLQDADWKPGPGFDAWLAGFEQDFVGATRTFVKSMFPKDADPALVETMVARMSAMPGDIGVTVLRSIFAYHVPAALAQVKQPIRAIESDVYPVRLETNRRYAPRFEAVIIPGTGHFPMMEKPAEFNRLLAGAIADVAP